MAARLVPCGRRAELGSASPPGKAGVPDLDSAQGFAMPRFTPIVTLLAMALYFFLATRVAAARGKFGVQLPAG